MNKKLLALTILLLVASLYFGGQALLWIVEYYNWESENFIGILIFGILGLWSLVFAVCCILRMLNNKKGEKEP